MTQIASLYLFYRNRLCSINSYIALEQWQHNDRTTNNIFIIILPYIYYYYLIRMEGEEENA